MRLKKILLISFLALIVFGLLFAYLGYNAIYGPNVNAEEGRVFFIEQNDEASDILANLKEQRIFETSDYLDLIADRMSFKQSSPKPGRYIIEHRSSIYDALNTLRLGNQTPVSLTIRGFRKIEDLAGYLGAHLMYDSTHYIKSIREDTYTSLCNFLPDTYEFYWSTSGPDFDTRMKTYAEQFWAGKRLTILGKSFLPCEVITLASIVEKETAYDKEKPDVAGVYINRLKKNMPLQADPTVIYSMNDFSIRRVLKRYLSVESPYNTYLHTGLPPGPICMPSKASILAVINANKHDYIYFCAKADNSGTHAFAETLAQHNRNARAFQRWLNQRGIRN